MYELMSEERRQARAQKIGRALKNRYKDKTKHPAYGVRYAGSERAQKIGDRLRGKPKSLDHVALMRDITRQKWQDPEYVASQMRARGVGQNKLEKMLEELTGLQFVGDGRLVIGGKCPDFWDGGTKLVELYGDYWHRGQNPQDRIDFFDQRGYSCLVVWESELLGRPEEVVSRVREFIS